MDDLLRKVQNNFVMKWKAKTREEKLRDSDFVTMLRDLQNGSLSLYRGDGSREFMGEIAAAMAIARGSIEKNHVYRIAYV